VSTLLKYIFLLLTVSYLWFSESHAQLPTDSLKGHYLFNGTLIDISGNDNNISTGSGTYTTDRFNYPNNALYLNGLNDSLVIPIPEFAPITGDFTFSFWYKTNSPEILNIISSKENPSDTSENFELQFSSHNAFYLEFYLQSFYQTFVYWNGIGDNNNSVAEGSPGLMTKGDWCHFVLTREADTCRIYRNHQEYYLSENSLYGGILGDSVDLVFSASPHPFRGAIDDMRFYNRALSQTEIDLLWFENNPIAFVNPKATDAYVQGSNLLVYWEFDATQISDSIHVQLKLNDDPWIDAEHSNDANQNYLYIDMTYPPGTLLEVRVTDYVNPLLTKTTGSFAVSEYDWVEVSSELPFNAKDGSGLLNFQNKMWLLGGWDPPYHPPLNTHNEIWSSTDGPNWNYEGDAPWPARHAAAWLTTEDAMWVVGGDPQSGCLTDVWKSNDGINWVQTIDAIPDYVIRNNPNYAVLNDQLFIFGGEQCSGSPKNDVWTSVDGVNWNQLPDAPWSGRGMQLNSCIDENGSMWMLGGSNEASRRSYNEVWKTEDGINWTLVNESAPWAGRYWHTVASFDHKIWLMGGMATGIEMNDVWYSEDGINWREFKSTTGNVPLGTRHAQSTTVFDNALWYMCGIATNNAWKIVNVSDTTSLQEEILSENRMILFPNPADDKLTIQFYGNLFNGGKIEIYNSLGQLVMEESNVSGLSHTIDIAHLKRGLYFVRSTVFGKSTCTFLKL
jgi:hypothetical protein